MVVRRSMMEIMTTIREMIEVGVEVAAVAGAVGKLRRGVE
jgi:hypothetical protein